MEAIKDMEGMEGTWGHMRGQKMDMETGEDMEMEAIKDMEGHGGHGGDMGDTWGSRRWM